MTNSEEFQDPLENYDPREYDDPLEQALVENEVGTIRHAPFTSISPDTTVEEAIQQMASLHVACLLVAEGDKLVGVFSERDVLAKVGLEFDAAKDKPIREFMTDDPIYVFETASAISALSVMAVCGYRHVPIVDASEKLTGIVSPQRLMEFLQQNSQS